MQRYSIKSIRITDLKNVLIRHATSTLLFQETILEKYTVVQPVPNLWPRGCSDSENGKSIPLIFDDLLFYYPLRENHSGALFIIYSLCLPPLEYLCLLISYNSVTLFNVSICICILNP